MGVKSNQRQALLKALKCMAYAQSEEKYMELYEKFTEMGFEKANHYFDTNWHPIRHQWVEGLKGRVGTLGNRTNNRLESVNKHVKSVVQRFSSLLQFFKDLDIAIDCTAPPCTPPAYVPGRICQIHKLEK